MGRHGRMEGGREETRTHLEVEEGSRFEGKVRLEPNVLLHVATTAAPNCHVDRLEPTAWEGRRREVGRREELERPGMLVEGTRRHTCLYDADSLRERG
eukprot:286879-Rhodomonas_salina.1